MSSSNSKKFKTFKELREIDMVTITEMDPSEFAHLSEQEKWKLLEELHPLQVNAGDIIINFNKDGINNPNNLINAVANIVEDFTIVNRENRKRTLPLNVVGATGTGKTFILSKIQNYTRNPIWVETSASSVTPPGYKGEDPAAPIKDALLIAQDITIKAYQKIFNIPRIQYPELDERVIKAIIGNCERNSQIFIDEFDKCRFPVNSKGDNSFKEGVQLAYMRLLGGDVPYPISDLLEPPADPNNSIDYTGYSVSSKNMLFVMGGAYHGTSVADNCLRGNKLRDAEAMGIKAELLGRLDKPVEVDECFGFHPSCKDGGKQEVQIYKKVATSHIKDACLFIANKVKIELANGKSDIKDVKVTFTDKAKQALAERIAVLNRGGEAGEPEANYKPFEGMRKVAKTLSKIRGIATRLHDDLSIFNSSYVDEKNIYHIIVDAPQIKSLTSEKVEMQVNQKIDQYTANLQDGVENKVIKIADLPKEKAVKKAEGSDKEDYNTDLGFQTDLNETESFQANALMNALMNPLSDSVYQDTSLLIPGYNLSGVPSTEPLLGRHNDNSDKNGNTEEIQNGYDNKFIADIIRKRINKVNNSSLDSFLQNIIDMENNRDDSSRSR